MKVLIILLLLVVLHFEYSKFELFVGDLWVVLSHACHKVLIRVIND